MLQLITELIKLGNDDPYKCENTCGMNWSNIHILWANLETKVDYKIFNVRLGMYQV